jgi:RAP1 GTPase activating protein 1
MFQDGDTPFQFSSVTSKQNHIFAIVKPKGDGYSLTVVTKTGVPAFSPELPEPSYFERDAVSRDFLLHKRKYSFLLIIVVNSERASYKSPSFAPKISRTRSVLLYDVAERFLTK